MYMVEKVFDILQNKVENSINETLKWYSTLGPKIVFRIIKKYYSKLFMVQLRILCLCIMVDKVLDILHDKVGNSIN